MKFEINEIAVLCKSYSHPEREGEECEITGIGVTSTDGAPRDYAVKYKNIPGHPKSGHWCVDEHQLKKKKPPKEIDWVKMCNLDKLPEIA